jgi:DNA-binding transcriptional LysR family regulator
MSVEPFDLDDMQLFIRVAESNNLTCAARRSHISLAAASMRVRNVERKIGTSLFYRHSQGVELTPAGEAFLRYSLITVHDVESLMNEIRDYVTGTKGQLRVSANTNSLEFLPAALTAFLSAHPGVTIDLKERASRDIVRAIAEGHSDMGIVAGDVETEDLQVWPYRRDHLVLATSVHHVLSGRKAIRFDETLDFEYVVLSEQSAMQMFLSAVGREIDKPMKVRIQVGDFGRMCRMIAANIGVGILPESAARRHQKNANIRVVQLQDNWAMRNLRICVRDLALLPPFAKDLINILVTDTAH